ncbi:hypothetical protein BDV96DRAFT_145287 [Lophiotrema nucula]|uniref:Fungal-specific transcription factor domain-containing protein n=1 Tax=Lophiotrema nucula TaxID=690887 RepID=A0A6A5Z090_9PLEO|nr:hypothetical protein BDV96DRAFT_145287 [Lophiotrema nucula]
MLETLASTQHASKSPKTEFLFITTSTIPQRLKKGDALRHAISSHAAKARVSGAGSSRFDKDELTARPTKWKDSRKIREKYTAKIKLQSWRRKSGRRRAPDRTEKQELQPDPTWLQVRTGALIVHELSPPNPLPISFFPNTGILLNFYHCLNTNSFALNPDGDWFDLIRGDAAALHALISVAGRIRALQLGKEEETDVSRHKSEALKLINQQLSANDGILTDTLIAAVAVLVNQEAMSSSFESATIHMQGLAQMVQLRGGLASVNSRLVLQRVIAWGDFSYSTTWGRPLFFPRLASLDARLPPSLRRSGSNTLKAAYASESHALPQTLFDAFDLLNAITYAIDNFETGNFGRRDISDSIYHAEYMLSELNSQVTPLGNDHTAAALTAAALLFSHLCIRSLPVNAPRHRFLFSSLHSILQDSTLALDPQDLEAQNCVLLWLHCVGAADESKSIPRGLHIAEIERLCIALELRMYEDFETSLKLVLWVEEYPYARRVWEDVSLSLAIEQDL